MALEQGPERLHEDHANARLLAEALAHMEGVEIDLDTVETNIVIFRSRVAAKRAEVDGAAQGARHSHERGGAELGASGDTSGRGPRARA